MLNDNKFLSSETVSGRLMRVIIPVLWVVTIVTVVTLIGWNTMPWAPIVLFAIGFGVPVFICFFVPWLYALYTWIVDDQADFLWWNC